MAYTAALKTWTNEILYAADLNAEFTNVYNSMNGTLGNDAAFAAITAGGAVSGVTSLAMGGALSGVTSLAMGGALSGVTTLGLSGAITGLNAASFTHSFKSSDTDGFAALTVTSDDDNFIRLLKYGSVATGTYVTGLNKAGLSVVDVPTGASALAFAMGGDKTIYFITNAAKQANISSSGLAVTAGFGCNSKTAQTAYALGAALSTGGQVSNADICTKINSIQAALVANGICSV